MGVGILANQNLSLTYQCILKGEDVRQCEKCRLEHRNEMSHGHVPYPDC